MESLIASAREQLLAYYEQWRLFTEEEGKAIQRAAWDSVSEFQEAKGRLRDRIVHVNERLPGELALSSARTQDLEREIRAIIEDLVVLETRNSEWLAEKKKEASEEQRSAQRAGRALKQIHHAYAGVKAAAWHSYS